MSSSPPERSGSSRPRVPRLLAISDGEARDPRDGEDPVFDAWLERVATAGVDAVQLREKHLDDRSLFELARRARERLPNEVSLLVNGRADVALAAEADGVHLPSSGLPVAALRRRFGARLLIGRSTHSPAEVAAAREDGADYVTFGPVYATPSKAACGSPPGLEGLRRAAAVGLPVLALGGVDAEHLAEVATAGAAGAAGIRAFHDPHTLGDLVRRAREVFS
jgi:thiamine-phosphate pyrophosphorylase